LHSLSFYDALIVQAAMVSGCQQILSEDMQHGARFGAVQIVNPFANSPY
jgi:predicted nucleic acid-binding protein